MSHLLPSDTNTSDGSMLLSYRFSEIFSRSDCWPASLP